MLGFTCFDNMKALRLVLITNGLYKIMMMRLQCLKTPLLFLVCMASHYDHLVVRSCMIWNTWHGLHSFLSYALSLYQWCGTVAIWDFNVWGCPSSFGHAWCCFKITFTSSSIWSRALDMIFIHSLVRHFLSHDEVAQYLLILGEFRI